MSHQYINIKYVHFYFIAIEFFFYMNFISLNDFIYIGII